MRILINSVSAKMGGAATYIRELAAQIGAVRSKGDFVFLVPPEHAEQIRRLAPNCRVLPVDIAHASPWKRLWFDDIGLRRLLRREKIDVLFSAASFGMAGCPCRQVLLVRNSLYFSRLYGERFLPGQPWRKRLAHRLRKWVACRGIHSADLVMTPSQAILDEIRQTVPLPNDKAVVNPYGVDKARFSNPSIRHDSYHRPFTLLFTSLYADHKNLGNLLRAVKQLVSGGSKLRLLTTADPNWTLAKRETQHWKEDLELASEPPLKDCVEFVFQNPGSSDLYFAADLFVYPSVVESFGHPLVEAMAAGLPIIAADVPINRELCHDAALYFSPFDASDLADKIEATMNDPALRRELAVKSFARCDFFRWERHLETLLSCAHGKISQESHQITQAEEVRA